MNKNIKICFVANTSFYIQNYRVGLMQTLCDHGIEILVAAPPDDYTIEIIKRFRFIPLRYLSRKGLNPLKDIIFLAELYQIYRREKPDLILHFTIKPNIYGSIAARLAHCHTLNTVTGGGYAFSEKSTLSSLVKALYKTAFLFPQKVIFQNEDDRLFFIKSGLLLRHRTRLIRGSGVNSHHFAPPCLDIMKNQRFTFLLVTRMLWDKGINEYVQAAELVKHQQYEADFKLLGPIDQGNPEAIPRHMIQLWEEEIGVKYLGTTKDVRPFIAQSSVLVLPSYREGLPRALLEGMAMAKPIITTDAIGCREVVEEGKNGFMVPVKNAQALAEAMLKMMELGNDKLHEMGRYGRKKVLDEFDEKIVIRQYLEEIAKINPKVRLLI